MRRPTDDGFTERFQYLVASSGLLEKTQILSLVSAQEEDNPPVPPEAGDKLEMIVRSQQHRWDIYAASAVVIMSVLYVLGLSMLLVPSAAVAGGAALLLPSKSDSTSEVATDAKGDSTMDTAPKEEPTPPEDSTTRVFNTLNALLAESRSLDQAIGTAMSLLAPRPDDIENAHSLRIALHRLFSDMTDSLAATTSTLIPMADRSELAVLGDMYDIPVLGNRRRRASSSSSEGSTTTPVPHRQRSLSTSEAVTTGDDPSTPAAAAADASDRFTPLPVRHLRHKRSESRGLGFDHSPAASPLRPYHAQHQREASVETRQHDGDEAMSVASTSTDSSSLAPSSLPEQLNGSRPPVGPASRAVMMSFTPKRASPLAHTGNSLERPDAAPSSFPANAAPSSFPASARTTSPTSFHMRPSQSPFRRSLQDIPYIHTPPSSTAEQAAELAKARATSNMSSAKRRSLQTPYNLDLQREQVLVEANAGGLTRASSLQYTNRSAHSDALAALEGKRNVTEPVRSGLRPLTMSASLSTPNKRASSVWNTQISLPKSTPQPQVVESKSRNRNSIILDSGSGGTAAMAQSEAMSSKRSSTTLEGQTLLSSPDGSAASKRSSLLLDQGPAGKRVQQLLVEQSQNALGLGHSPRSASLGVHQPFQRVPSISPLTLGGLKASCHGVHLKRRRVACCLLGLRFAEPRSSSYWDDVCGEMRKLTEAMALGRESLDGAREDVERELSAQRALAESATRHSSPAAPLGNVDDGPVEFAPRSDPMLSSVDELQRTLARVWARCDELRQRGVTLEPDILASIWADVRSDVGGMLRQVERGREAVRSTNVSEAGATDPTDSEIMPISASSADMEPGFLGAWEVDAEEDEIERLVAGEDVPPDSEPYQEFLPPPGIDEVFEAAIPPAPPRPKTILSRDERIKAAKEARARGAAMDRLTANSKEPSPEPEVRGQVMQELEGVFGVIRQRKGYSRPPVPESPAMEPKPQSQSQPQSQPTTDSRISTPSSTPASARVTTPQSAPRLVASPSRSPTVLSPVQPQFGLPPVQPQFGLPRIGSPTFRVTSPTSGRIGSPTPSSRVTSPTPSSRERVSSPPPTAWSPRSAPRALSPTSARMTPPARMAAMSPPPTSTPLSPSPVSPRALSPTGPHTPSRSPSLSRQSSLTRAGSLTRPGASGARKQKGMSLQPIAATVPLATSPDAERRRSLQTLYESNSGEFKPIHLRAPEEVAEDEIGVAL